MPLKVLLLNFPKEEVLRVPDGIKITQATVESEPTLHDYHAIILDTREILDQIWWGKEIMPYHSFSLDAWEDSFRGKIRKQIETGGVTFCFSSSAYYSSITIRTYDGKREFPIQNYFFCPLNLGIVNESGDTFYQNTKN